MLHGVFVTGTDTGIGKTVVAAAIMSRYRDVASLRYWKPIQTGIEEDDDTKTVAELCECGPARILDKGVRLPRPLSPHLAATLSGVQIDLDALIETVAAEERSDRWVVEGAGGFLVPINGEALMSDLIAQLGLPVVVVARSSLGTINHTLLTLEALRLRAIPVVGVVMTGEKNTENRRAIEHYGHVAVLGELPRLEPLTAGTLRWAAAAIDPEGALGACFQ
jgi:malonyl-CoA O-methyltransferase